MDDLYYMSDSSESDGLAPHGLSVQQLLSAVENELIPRLLVAHRDDVKSGDSPARRARPVAGGWADEDSVERFAALCASEDEAGLQAHVSGLLSAGVGLDALYLYLVAPSARLLGQQWSDDAISFVDVQLGLGRLHALVCECVPIGFHHSAPGPHSVLLAAAPGDQHTFAIALVADFFRRFGWQASNLSGLSSDFLAERIASRRYDAIGFSIHTRGAFDALARLIPQLRRRSCNPHLVVMIGGEFVREEPQLLDSLDHDLFAEDAHGGVLEAERLVARARAAAGLASRTEGRFAMTE